MRVIYFTARKCSDGTLRDIQVQCKEGYSCEFRQVEDKVVAIVKLEDNPKGEK